MPPARKRTRANRVALGKRPLQERTFNTHLQAWPPSPLKPQVTHLHAQGVNSSQADVHPQDLLRQFGARTGSQQLRRADQEQGNTRQPPQRRRQIQERAQQLPTQEVPLQATLAPQIRVLHAVKVDRRYGML